MIKEILIIICAYLIGAIPFSVIVSRLKGVDLTKEAVDGARGTSLTWRKAGKVYGIIVAILDISKGILAVYLAKSFSGENIVIILAGLFAIIGHNWSIYLKFTGGKGAATTGGELLYLFPREFFIVGAITLIFLAIERKKEYLVFLKRKFRKPNFLSGVFFFLMFFATGCLYNFSTLTFSPLIFSFPMLIKDYQIKRNERVEKKSK